MKLKYKNETATLNTSEGIIEVVGGHCDVTDAQGEYLLKNFPAAFVKAFVEAVNDQITDAVTQAPKAPVAVLGKKK